MPALSGTEETRSIDFLHTKTSKFRLLEYLPVLGDDGQLYHESCALPRLIHGVDTATMAFNYGAAYAQA